MKSARRSFAVALGLALVFGGAAATEARAANQKSRGASASRPVAVRGHQGSKPTPGNTKTAVRGTGVSKPGSSTTVSGHGHWGHYGSQHYTGYYGYYGYAGYPYSYMAWGWPYCWGWPYYPGWYVGDPPGPGGATHPALAALELDVKPKKAGVRLDGEFVGQARDYNGTWDVLWVKPGGHEIEFSYDEHQTLKFWVEAHTAGYLRFTEHLNEGDGLDPRSTARPPAAPAVGEPVHEIELRGEAPAAADGLLRSGFLRIEADPADAAVYLDGEFLARADELARLHGALSVAYGTHVIEVVRPGYESQTAEAEIEDRQQVRVVVRLHRVE